MNIIIGKYININSFFHRLDPRIKLIIHIMTMVLLFSMKFWFFFALLGSLIIFSFLITTKRPVYLLKLFKIPFFVILVLIIWNSFSIKPDSIIKTVNNITIPLDNQVKAFFENSIIWNVNNLNVFVLSYSSILSAAIAGLRIYLMIIATTILTFSTKQVFLTKAIEDILLPFKIIKLPVHVFAMIISIALRFVPTILEESNRIIKAQSSRGVDFKNGTPKDKIKSMITLVIPLFVIAFQRAEDLSHAMEVRGYDPYDKRTRYRVLKINWIDILIFLFITSALIFTFIYQANTFNILSHNPVWIQYTLIGI